MTGAGTSRGAGDWWLGAWLISVYLVAHAVLIYQSLASPTNIGASDVSLYAWWLHQGKVTGGWVGIDSAWVYPVGALIPMLAASVFGTASSYLPTWCVMIALVNLGAAAVVVRRFGVARAAAPVAGWFVFLMLLGPCGIARLDAVMMPLVLVALVVAGSRPALAAVLLTCGAWIKVSAGAVLIPMFAVMKSWRERFAGLVAPAALTCLAVVTAQAALGGQPRFLTSFVTAETERGLQVEAVLATPVVLAHAWRGEALNAWNEVLSTHETWGPGADAAILVSDITMPLMAAAVGLLAWRARRRPAAALTVGALALMSGLIVTHKVGSPQFVAWVAPAVVVGLCLGRRRRFWFPVAFAALAAAALTGWLYPTGYAAFLSADAVMLTAWVVRNLLLVAIFAASIGELVRLRRAARLAEAAGFEPARGINSPNPLSRRAP